MQWFCLSLPARCLFRQGDLFGAIFEPLTTEVRGQFWQEPPAVRSEQVSMKFWPTLSSPWPASSTGVSWQWLKASSEKWSFWKTLTFCPPSKPHFEPCSKSRHSWLPTSTHKEPSWLTFSRSLFKESIKWVLQLQCFYLGWALTFLGIICRDL